MNASSLLCVCGEQDRPRPTDKLVLRLLVALPGRLATATAAAAAAATVLFRISLIHICLYVCSCVHGTAEPLDGVDELPDTQTSQQTDVNETY